MTRPIKFRAWDKAEVGVYHSPTDPKRMSFYGEEFSMDDNQNCLQFFTPKGKQAPYGDHESMKRYELMQFTGLLDKNGKEVYEGDFLVDDDSEPMRHRIVWYEDEAKFELETLEDEQGNWGSLNIDSLAELGASGMKNFEIIGNIYSNPELLK